jgi:hypothetical protein
MKRLVELIRPGIQSILIPKEGTAQECITSLDVNNNLRGVLTGSQNLLSVSKSLRLPLETLSKG